MYSPPPRYAAAFLFLLAIGAALYFIARSTAGLTSVFAQTNDRRAEPVARDASGVLSGLLERDGVAVRSTDLLPSRVDESRSVLVHFESATKNLSSDGLEAALPQSSALSIAGSRSSKGPLTRQRSLDLSPEQVLMVAVDQNKRALWWSLQPDPRILHAESSDDEGKMSGKIVYRSSSDMVALYPASEEITELRFYHPEWDGRSYELKLVGVVATPVDKR